MKPSIVRELRAVQRYNVSLPVCVTWRAEGPPSPPLNAVTRDISTRGMFIISDAQPAAGDLLEFEIDMALDKNTPLVVVQGAGRVVRTERPSPELFGFAVHNLWFKLRQANQGQAQPLDFQAHAASATQPFSADKTMPSRGLTVVPREAVADSDLDSDQGESK